METLETVVQPETKTDDSIARPRAFIILGLEGAGTYMIQNALVEAGCGRNDRLDREPPDYLALSQFDGDIVIRKSFPHAGHWPRWNDLFRRCELTKHEVFIIWVIRSSHAQIQSVLRRDPKRYVHHLHDYQANYYKELSTIEDYSIDYEVITYSAFVHSEGFRRWLFEERLGLPYPEDFEVLTDRNSQYYQE